MIEAKNLTKYYNFAEKACSEKMQIFWQRGRGYGFLGPNGAAKSTTIKSIVNLLNYQGESQHLRLSESQSGGKKKFWLCAGGTDSLLRPAYCGRKHQFHW